MNIHYQETKYGFDYGAAKITRLFSDEKKKWITLGLETPKHEGHNAIQIYVTKTGKVRIHDSRGEWSQPPAKITRQSKQSIVALMWEAIDERRCELIEMRSKLGGRTPAQETEFKKLQHIAMLRRQLIDPLPLKELRALLREAKAN